MADTSDDEPISNRLRAGVPPSKKPKIDPKPTANRYDAIVRHRMRNQPEVSHKHDADEANERRRLKQESIYQSDDTHSSSENGGLPTDPVTSKNTEPVQEQSTTPKNFYNWGSLEFKDQQRKQDDYHRRMEQLQTTRFINGLRRAVDDNLRSRGIQPNTHNLPNYAYNNTTKELARLHQQPE